MEENTRNPVERTRILVEFVYLNEHYLIQNLTKIKCVDVCGKLLLDSTVLSNSTLRKEVVHIVSGD